MKPIGITRNIDKLGRVTIPKELRDTLKIREQTPLEIYVENEKIILKKYEAGDASARTGEISNQNFSLANGKTTLSPEGYKLLMNDLKRLLAK
ncbi:TPA: AbrB/MazE/SpoVT family DNA-binding domain-containing protein [Bacillus cereus]|nr:AbrB/MazE/SpoVT family DNA-binding domain-containing protein [Bacillus cereus]